MCLGGALVGKHLLADVLASKGAPLQEIAAANLVAIEVPPVTKAGFEHRMLEVVQKLGGGTSRGNSAVGPTKPSEEDQQVHLDLQVEQNAESAAQVSSNLFVQGWESNARLPLSMLCGMQWGLWGRGLPRSAYDLRDFARST